MALPIYVPLLYVSILVGSLYMFSKWHRKSKEGESTPPCLPFVDLNKSSCGLWYHCGTT